MTIQTLWAASICLQYGADYKWWLGGKWLPEQVPSVSQDNSGGCRTHASPSKATGTIFPDWAHAHMHPVRHTQHTRM